MDANRFDDITRALVSATTRRLTVSALLGGALGALGLAEGEAKKKKCNPACGECQKCKKRKNKKGKCKPLTDGTRCTSPIGGTCQNGLCACPIGLTSCSDTCVNTQTDEANCGTCGTVCLANEVCQTGTCFPESTCASDTGTLCSVSAAGIPCALACFCGQSTEGNIVCVQNEAFCPPPPFVASCTTSADCPAGEACMDAVGCCAPALPAGSRVCMAPCAAPTASRSTASRSRSASGPGQ